MFDHEHYVPILKWRQAEYLALERSPVSIKDWVTPLFEVPLEPWDFENERPSKTLKEHLSKVGKKLKKAWNSRRCFFDSPNLDGADTVEDQHHLTHLFSLLRSDGCNAVPVTGLSRADAYQDAVREIQEHDGNGILLRLTPDDFEGTLVADIRETLRRVGVTARAADLIIDSDDDIPNSSGALATSWESMIKALPNIGQWRSLTVAAGSFPESLSPAQDYRPFKEIKRREWLAYKRLIGLDLPRRPTFGDYTTSSPSTTNLDPRVIDPNAKVKYTLESVWRVHVGQKVKRYGRDQYRELCAGIVKSDPSIFDGPKYSWGDLTIADCAAGGGTGNSGTWPQVASSHHIAKTVRTLANLYGSSSIP